MSNNRDNFDAPLEPEETGDDYELIESNPKLPPAATSVKPTDQVSPDSVRAQAMRPLSGRGGPVARTTKQVRPSGSSRRSPTTQVLDGADQAYGEEGGAPVNKGKITAKKAKLIWIICIAVSALALVAFVCDVAFDLFGRRGGQQGQGTNIAGNQPSNRPKIPDKTKSPHEVNADNFIRAVGSLRARIRDTKAYDFYMLAFKRFERTQENAKKIRAVHGPGDKLDQANAEMIAAYWDAQYAAQLYTEHFRKQLPPELEDYPGGISLDNRQDVLGLDDKYLKAYACQRYQASELAIAHLVKSVNQWRKDFLALAANVPVWESKDWEKKVWGANKRKLELAQQNKEFVEADLEFVSGPDYAENDTPEHMKDPPHDKGGG